MKLINQFLLGSFLLCVNGFCLANEIDKQTLQNNLAYGTVIELNQYGLGQEKSLLLRLFGTRDQNEECGLETSGVCKNQYLLTSSTFDEMPETQAYSLRAKGEFVKAKWINQNSDSAGPDQAELTLTFREYSQSATGTNNKLARKIFRVKVKVTQDGIEETRLPN
jgi:hypothetical protein